MSYNLGENAILKYILYWIILYSSLLFSIVLWKPLQVLSSELNVDNWKDNCEAKSEAKSPRPLRGFQVDSSLTRNVPYAVR